MVSNDSFVEDAPAPALLDQDPVAKKWCAHITQNKRKLYNIIRTYKVYTNNVSCV